MEEPDHDEASVAELFRRMTSEYRGLESLEDKEIRNKTSNLLKDFENFQQLLKKLDLFSENEELGDISTTSLEYYSAPAYSALLASRIGGSSLERKSCLLVARNYSLQFIQWCLKIGIASPLHKTLFDTICGSENSSKYEGNLAPVFVPTISRDIKIRQFKEKKCAEERLAVVSAEISKIQASRGNDIDEELLRERVFLQLGFLLDSCLENLSFIDLELSVLACKDQSKGIQSNKRDLDLQTPLKPYVITREAVSANVYGAGYPSLPTMTVEEWADRQMKNGCFLQGGTEKPSKCEDEVDTDERIQELRRLDAWKDDHPRGWGNRINMG
eukprot:Sdes_comp15401_c0_seq1m4279